MTSKAEANPAFQKSKGSSNVVNNVNEQSKEPDMKTRFSILKKMKEDLDKINRKERRGNDNEEYNDNSNGNGNKCNVRRKKDDKNSLLKLVEAKKKKMMIQKKYESMNGVNIGVIHEHNESEEESTSKRNMETPLKFKDNAMINNNIKEFKVDDECKERMSVKHMQQEQKSGDIIEEGEENGNRSDDSHVKDDNNEIQCKEDEKRDDCGIKDNDEDKNEIKKRLLKLALDKKMKKEEEIKENNEVINNNEHDNSINDDNDNEQNEHISPIKNNSSSKTELLNIIDILKSKSPKKQQDNQNTNSPNKETNSQSLEQETTTPKNNTSQNEPQPPSPIKLQPNQPLNTQKDNNKEEDEEMQNYKKELEERAIKRNKYLEFKKQQQIQKRKYEEELAEQKRLEEIQRKEIEKQAEITKKLKEEQIRLERIQQEEATETKKRKREERKHRDALRKAGEQRLEREVKRQEQRKEFEFKRLELKLNNKGKDVITVNGSFDRSIDGINTNNNDSNTNYYSELTYVKQTPISKRKNISDAVSPKQDNNKKDICKQLVKELPEQKKRNVFETEMKIKMKLPVTLIYSPKRVKRSSSNEKLSRSIIDVNECKDSNNINIHNNKVCNMNKPYKKQRSGGLSVDKKSSAHINNNYNQYSQYNNNIRMNSFLKHNNNNINNNNYGQNALIDDHFSSLNYMNHNNNNTNNNNKTNFYTTMPNLNYNINNNNNSNSNINNNSTNSNNNINHHYQISSLLPPAPPIPKPKQQYSLNIEDLITLEEKLSEIASALNLNQYIRNECFEWWNYYYHNSTYSQIHFVFDKTHQPFIERSIKYQLFAILICYDISSNQYIFSSIAHMIQAILNRNHMNFILICEYVLSKISSDNIDNVWVYKLRHIVNTHKLNNVNLIHEYGENFSYVDKINSNTNSIVNDIKIIVKYYQNSNPQAEELYYLLMKIEQMSYNEINGVVKERFMIGQQMNNNILPYDYNYNSNVRDSSNFNFGSENNSYNVGCNGGNGNNYFNGGNNSECFLDSQDVYGGGDLELNGNYY